MSKLLEDPFNLLLTISPESRTEQLQSLLILSQTTPFVLQNSLKRLPYLMKTLLSDLSNFETPLLATQLLSSLIMVFAKDLEPLILETLGFVVVNLGHSQVKKREIFYIYFLSILIASP